MKKRTALVLAVLLLSTLSACASPQTDPSKSTGASPTPKASKATGSTAKATAKTTASPLVYKPEELLSAEEATGLVGFVISIEPDSLFTDTDSGSVSQRYQYDIPSKSGSSTTTVHALLQITQNGLISAEKLKQGHDAKWAFNTEKSFSANDITGIPNLGKDAFYFTATSQVHMLCGDYYIVIAFEKDPYENAPNVDLNKAIAAFIVGKLSRAGVSLT